VLTHKYWDGYSISSFRYSPKNNRCEITMTRIGSGGVGPQVWMCAYISEIAACNGSADVNGDQRKADGTRMSWGDQWAYVGRLCETMDIPIKAMSGSMISWPTVPSPPVNIDRRCDPPRHG
jgi:hypothetical protein